MKLNTYNNLYAYFITHALSSSNGSEVILKYEKKSKQYSVVKLVNFTLIDSFNTNSPYVAKGIFREWIK
jgi:hypothetical protein